MSLTPLNTVQLPTPTDTPKAMEQDEPSPVSYVNNSSTWTPVDGMTPISTNPSRKRSRDEPSFEHDADGGYFNGVDAPPPIPEEEPIYGEGMVLLNPRTGMPMSAESQTGTWYEEKQAEEKALAEQAAMTASSRPIISARKSMRLSQSSIRLHMDGANNSAPASPPKTASDRSEIDDAAIALGIGWSQMSNEDEGIQAAARGWARYLDNHYSRFLHGSQILLKSSGLNAYLVGAQEGFFLFSEDLLEGKLVGRTWERCLQNLRSHPMQFEGDDVLRAERTPGPESMQCQEETKKSMEPWTEQNRSNSYSAAPVTNGGMELD